MHTDRLRKDGKVFHPTGAPGAPGSVACCVQYQVNAHAQAISTKKKKVIQPSESAVRSGSEEDSGVLMVCS